jgi:hypothetical protein
MATNAGAGVSVRVATPSDRESKNADTLAAAPIAAMTRAKARICQTDGWNLPITGPVSKPRVARAFHQGYELEASIIAWILGKKRGGAPVRRL